MWFSWEYPGKSWDTALKYATTASFHILPNISFTINLTLDAAPVNKIMIVFSKVTPFHPRLKSCSLQSNMICVYSGGAASRVPSTIST